MKSLAFPRRFVTVGLVAAVAAAAPGGCVRERVDPLDEARAIGRADPATMALLAPAVDGFTLQGEGYASAGLRAANQGNHNALATMLPTHAAGSVALGPGFVRSLRLSLSPKGLRDVPGELHEGKVLYPDVVDGVDEIAASNSSLAELFYLIRTDTAPHTFSWDVTLPQGIRSVETRADGLWFLDAARSFVLRVPSAYAIDARGQRHAASLTWNRETHELSVALPRSESLAYPVLLNPAFETSVWSELRTPVEISSPAVSYDSVRNDFFLYGNGKTWTWDGSAWTDHPIPRNGIYPSYRSLASVAFDERREEVVLFGGTSTKTLADTWLWDGTRWRQGTSGTAPPARYGAAMVYDRDRGEVVLFGGMGATGSDLQDTWIWDGKSWAERSPSVKPQGRYVATFAYDSNRKRAVLFGGSTSQVGLLADTWEWNGAQWQEIATPPGKAPSARLSASAAFDELRGEVVLFGGATNAGEAGDTWTYGGAGWKQVRSAVAPPAQSDPSMAYARNQKRVLLYGRQTLGGKGSAVWAWDGKIWSAVQGTPSPPKDDARTAMYADTGRKEIQLFLDRGAGGPQGWGYAGNSWSPRGYLAVPPDATMVWDPARTKLLSFGGAGPEGPTQDTWAFADSAWALLRPSRSPPPRNFPRLAFHAPSQKVVLFGGVGSSYLDDTWTWDGSTWTEVLPAAKPSPRARFELAADPVSGRLVLYGGDNGDAQFSDTWTWDGVTWREEALATAQQLNLWQRLLVTTDAAAVLLAPDNVAFRWDDGNRRWAGMTQNTPSLADWGGNPIGIWNPVSREIVLVAQNLASEFRISLLNNTVEGYQGLQLYQSSLGWNGTTIVRNGYKSEDAGRPSSHVYLPGNPPSWKRLPIGSAYPFELAAVTFDATRGLGVLIGTDDDIVPRTWTWDGSNMRRLGDVPAPGRLIRSAAAYDATRKTTVLFGGRDDFGRDTDKTWTLASDSDTWVLASPAMSPQARSFAALAYDARNNVVLLYGGSSYNTQTAQTTYLSDTWTWDGANWLKLSPPLNPGPRSGHSLSFDATRGAVLLFGGDLSGMPRNDTWAWDGSKWSEITTKVSPLARSNHAVAYLEDQRRSILFGGGPGPNTEFAWAFYSRGGACSSGTQCGTGACVDGVCCETPGCGTCETCAGADPGVCTPVTNAEDPDTCPLSDRRSCNEKAQCGPVLGGSCTKGSDCGSGICVSGVCCDTSCDAPCEACRAAEKASGRDDGRCGVAKTGSNPGGRCSGAATCTAKGSCGESVGTLCRDGRYLDTLGGGTKDCAPYKCAGRCLTRCSSALDCVFPATCDPNGVCTSAPSLPVDEGGCSLAAPRNGAGSLAMLVTVASSLWLQRRRSRTERRS